MCLPSKLACDQLRLILTSLQDVLARFGGIRRKGAVVFVLAQGVAIDPDDPLIRLAGRFGCLFLEGKGDEKKARKARKARTEKKTSESEPSLSLTECMMDL